MARIVDTGNSVTSRTSTHVTLTLGVDILFTAAELAEGRSGAATYSVACVVWDDGTFSDDRIVGATRVIARDAMERMTGIDFPAELKLSDLRRREPSVEDGIELFGEFTVMKDGRAIAPSAKSRNVTVKLPDPPPATSNSGQRISVRTEGSGPSTIAIVSGTGFKASALVVIRFTDSALNQLRATATADSGGKLEARRSVPCAPGISFTVTAFEDANPTGSFANTIVMSCP